MMLARDFLGILAQGAIQRHGIDLFEGTTAAAAQRRV